MAHRTYPHAIPRSVNKRWLRLLQQRLALAVADTVTGAAGTMSVLRHTVSSNVRSTPTGEG